MEYMKQKHNDTLLVQIDDAWVIKDDMDCLFHDHEHVNGAVSMFNIAFKLIN
jgi:hypothetical protein